MKNAYHFCTCALCGKETKCVPTRVQNGDQSVRVLVCEGGCERTRTMDEKDNKIEELEEEVLSLEQSVNEKDATIESLDDRIIELNKQIRNMELDCDERIRSMEYDMDRMKDDYDRQVRSLEDHLSDADYQIRNLEAEVQNARYRDY